jgi:hypothetical protein
LENRLQNLCRTFILGHDDPVVHPLTVAPALHYPCVSQISQASGNLWLGLTKDLDEVADTDLLVPHKIQEAQPSIVPERLKESLDIEISFAFYRHTK